MAVEDRALAADRGGDDGAEPLGQRRDLAPGSGDDRPAAADQQRSLGCGQRSGGGFHRLGRRRGAERRKQIGRASCRERVCQYVWISVVAVSLKKKKNTSTVVLTQLHQSSIS